MVRLLQVTSSAWVKQLEFLRSTEGNPTREVTAKCATLHFIVSRIHVIKVDTYNTRISGVKEVLVGQGPGYLKLAFHNKLKNGVITLEHTEAWMSRSVSKLLHSSKPVMCINHVVSNNPVIYKRLLFFALVNLVSEAHLLTDVPETLLMDWERIDALNKLMSIQVLSVIIITTTEYACIGLLTNGKAKDNAIEDVKCIVSEFPPRAFAPERTIDVVMARLDHVLPLANRDIVKSMLKKNIKDSSDVFASALRIVVVAWYHAMMHGGEVPGLPSYLKHIYTSIVQKSGYLNRVMKVGMVVHAKHYMNVIEKACISAAALKKVVDGVLVIDHTKDGTA
jgi:hypothetical protein